jgi:hypothetical protein
VAANLWLHSAVFCDYNSFLQNLVVLWLGFRNHGDDDKIKACFSNIRSCRLRAFAQPGLRANAVRSFLGCLRAYVSSLNILLGVVFTNLLSPRFCGLQIYCVIHLFIFELFICLFWSYSFVYFGVFHLFILHCNLGGQWWKTYIKHTIFGDWLVHSVCHAVKSAILRSIYTWSPLNSSFFISVLPSSFGVDLFMLVRSWKTY